ncbi:unnamed protein product [Microthlaspi erraticum]|uniref:Acetyltransferase n=1 Tax=Microthlaspi erraticum TaxID=1685480 RepID=A0A6D2KRY0_9BRAS|nr:unnamed protein product [Microthlaspi erraticum]
MLNRGGSSAFSLYCDPREMILVVCKNGVLGEAVGAANCEVLRTALGFNAHNTWFALFTKISPIFLLRLGYVQRGLLFPKPNSKIELVSRLKTSLSVALDHFYPFAGQLVKVKNEDDDHTVSFFVNCDGGGPGVKFVHAKAEKISIGDVLRYGSVENGFLSSFFPAYGIKNYQGVSNPLLMVQVTEMKDGFFIGVSYNHTVADDSSIWMFIKTWSKICSKDSRIVGRPNLLLNDWFFDGIDYPINIPDPEIEAPSSDVSSRPTVLQEIAFHVTNENVLRLKAKANDEAGSTDVNISSLQAVLAHIWGSTVRLEP